MLDEDGQPLDLPDVRRARGGGDLGRLARRGGVGLAQPARHLRRAHLAPGRRPACLPEVPAARDLGLHRGVPERRVRAQPADRPGARRAVRACVSTHPASAISRPSRPSAFEILADLDQVKSLDEDRILRAAARARRTPPCARTRSVRGGGYLSFKLRSADVPDMPKPLPLYEIFVYSPEMEGIHLRGGKVARGGIRWSDRRGGLPHRDPRPDEGADGEERHHRPGRLEGRLRAEPPAGRHARSSSATSSSSTRRSIRGMLDLTDNLVAGEVVHPARRARARRDRPVPRRGRRQGDRDVLGHRERQSRPSTASGSATRSRPAARTATTTRQLGITAKGAWESVKRHFRELGHDVTTAAVHRRRASVTCPATSSATACCSPSRSGSSPRSTTATCSSTRIRTRRLVRRAQAALRAARVVVGRLRPLEDLPGRRGLVAPGEVDTAAPEAREALGIEHATAATPTTDAHVGDPQGAGRPLLERRHRDVRQGDGRDATPTSATASNDAIRVNGADLRARVVGEGAISGSHSAVASSTRTPGAASTPTSSTTRPASISPTTRSTSRSCSGFAVAAGDLTLKQRNELLDAVEQDVAAHVLYDNYLQAQILSQEEAVSAERIEAYEDLMAALEAEGMLEREIEACPSTEEMAERPGRAGRWHGPSSASCSPTQSAASSRRSRSSTLPDDPFLDTRCAGTSRPPSSSGSAT